ncbi:MAG TPA: radical SAM protein [Pyrinomonadaceae bacterium]
MGVELRPLGVKCNIQCQYCYQNPQRDTNNILHAYDLGKMKAAIEEEGRPFTLFGGEPLMVPINDLQALWSWGYERYGENSIQTNGTLINEDHIRMFREYRVHVGISIDGPGELNDVRWVGSLERTRAATASAVAAIERLCREGSPPSIIITLHRCNATRERLPVLQDWLLGLERLGITSVRLHMLEVDNALVRQKYALSSEENLEAMLSFLRFERAKLSTMRFDVFREMRSLLLGEDSTTTCVWNACDPYTTRAVRGIEGNGQSSNCGRTNKDGIDFVKSDREGFERYLALYHTPQEFGGCKDCRYFLMCKGQCPGTSIDGDWRNRSEHCGVWMGLFHHLEKELMREGLRPLSDRPERREIEGVFVGQLKGGRNLTVAQCLEEFMNARQQEGPSEAPA